MKLPFFIETQLNKLLKPQIVTIVETFIDGKPSKKFYGKSLVANWLQFLYAQLNANSGGYQNSMAPYNNQIGVQRADTGAIANVGSLNPMNSHGGLNVVNEGIILGSAVVVPTPASFNVGTVITSGVGANQLQYLVQTSIQGVEATGQNSSFILSRSYNNASGGNVTVNAIAIYSKVTTNPYMLYLDSVTPSDVIGNGELYTVNITFQITT
jgi:hypothetical protein